MNIGTNSLPNNVKSWANGQMAIVDNSYKKAQELDAMAGLIYRDSTENWEDRITEVYASGRMAVWNDGDRAASGEIKEGYVKTFTQVPFGLEFPIGRLFNKFQKRDVRASKRDMMKLASEAFLTKQKAEASLYSYGFSDTNTYLSELTGSTVSALLPDGKRLFSVAHPISPSNATTWSNADANSYKVSEEGLEALLLLLDAQVDSDGRRKFYGLRGVIWSVSRNDYDKAVRIVNGELRQGTADNDIRVFNNKKVADGYYNGTQIEVRLVPWYSEVSTTAHFVTAVEAIEEEMALVCLEAQPFTTDSYTDDSTKTLYVRGEQIFTVGAVSGRGLAGSNGTEVAYAS